MLGSALAHRVDQRQRGLALGQIIADVFAKGVCIAAIIQEIVDQLEGHTQMVTKGAQGFTLLVTGLGEGAGTVSRGLEQHRGLAADDFHIGFFSGAGVPHLGQLQHFAFGNDARGLGQNAHDGHRTELDHHLERARIQEIAYQYAGRIAPHGVGGRAAAAHAGHVDHVVVQQRGGMQELDGSGQQIQVVALMPQRLATEQHQQRAQAFAPGRGDVIADFGHQRNARRQLLLDDFVNGDKIIRHGAVESLGLHQRKALQKGCAAC